MIVNKKERSADMEIGMCDWVLERLNEYIAYFVQIFLEKSFYPLI